MNTNSIAQSKDENRQKDFKVITTVILLEQVEMEAAACLPISLLPVDVQAAGWHSLANL